MAKRDVQLVIRAKDEASRALDKIGDLIGQLDIRQKGATASGQSFGASLVETARNMAQLEQATGLVVAASNRAEAAIDRQRAAVAGTGAEIAAVAQQLAAAQQAIDSAQSRVVDARLSGGDAKGEVAQLQAAEAAVRDLEAQQARLTRTLGQQEATLENQERNFHQLASSANTAEAALSSFGDDAARNQLKLAAATEESSRALQQEAAAADEANRALRARAFFERDNNAGTSVDTAASKTVLADQLRALDAQQQQAEAADDRRDKEERLNRELIDRARLEAAIASNFSNTGIEARNTALAEQLRLEEAAAEEKEQSAAAADREAAALQRLTDRINPLAAIERRLRTETEQLSNAYENGRLDVDQYRRALGQLEAEANTAREALTRRGRGEAGAVGLFGLKPYELTNMGYQVNDVITQLASGAPVFQVLAQQGGQILQLLPNIGARLTALITNPFFLVGAAAFTAVAVSVKQAADDAERLGRVEALLTSISDSAGVTAEELSGVVDQIERIGFSSEEALELARAFISEGLNLDYLREFAATAQNLADVTGQDLPEAVDRARRAFTAGYEAIADLDNELQFLTLAEREQIRAMFDSGRAAEAREQAFRIFSREMERQADLSRGPWKDAVRTLDRAFTDLLDTLGDTGFARSFVEGLEYIAQGIEDMLVRVEDADLELVERRIAILEEQQRANPELYDPELQRVTLFGGDNALEELENLRARRDAIIANADATGDLRDEEAEASRKRESDALAQIQIENDLANARTAAQRIALEGEQAYNDAVNAGHTERVAQARREQAIARQRREEERRDEQERRRREADFSDAIANNGRDGLLTTARGFNGLREDRANDNEILQNLFRAAGENVDPEMIAWCAAFVNAVLATNNLPTVDQVTSGSDLRARDFLNYGSEVARPEPGDIVILKRGNNAAQGHVGFFEGFTNSGDVRVLGGNQSDGVNTQTFDREDVLGFRRAPSQGDVAEQQLATATRLAEAQENLNEQIDRENEQRQRNIGFLEQQQFLTGEALIDAQREQAVIEAINTARERAIQRGEEDLAISEERLQAIRDTVEAEFDLINARERASAALDDASAVRDALLGRLERAQRTGNAVAVAEAENAIAGIDRVLAQAIERAIEFYRTLGGDNPQARAAIINLEEQLVSLQTDKRDRQRQRVEAPVAQLQATRNALQEQAQFYRELGQNAVVEQLLEQIAAVDEQLLGAIDTAIAFWQTQSGPDAQAALLQFENLRNQLLAAQNEFLITAGQIQDVFAGSFIAGFETFAETLAETRDPLEALYMGAIQFAADFTRRLAEMGLEVLAFKLATKIGFGGFADTFNSILGTGTLATSAATLTAAGGSVAAGGAAVTAGAAALSGSAAALAAAAQLLMVANATGGVFHGGGIAGMANRSRAVHPAWFSAAIRYHSGGVAGLLPNEVPAILERGEEILTRADPRHRFNGAGDDEAGQRSFGGLSQVLAIGDDAIARMMSSASGRRVILTTIREDRETVRSYLNE